MVAAADADSTAVAPLPAALQSWRSDFLEARENFERRSALTLQTDADSQLPIAAHREEIVRSIVENQVVIVCGETGSGKSTQLPKFCWDAGLGRRGWIGHTQPRRIAARSIASRLAAELGTPLGEVVGYKIRFADRVQAGTVIKLMTDGILLTELRHSRTLDEYDCLIIDEAHERSVNIDLTLAYLKQIAARRPDLRIVITSATIDAQKFAEYFANGSGPAPIFQVSGRMYPVEVRYRPLADSRDAFTEAVDELRSLPKGDILVFLPTERDIRFAARQLSGHLTAEGVLERFDILPLYARLSEEEQNRIFQQSWRQRIILATNVAESSLTVPGVRYVIDFGTARISRYAPRSKVQRLPVEAISQASANQRAGRCGRVAEGVCIRLYDEADYLGRPAYTTPEIRRANLASVLLQLKLAGGHDFDDLAWLEPPLLESVRDAKSTLHELAAIDEDQRLTEIGRKLGTWPVDPRVAKILLVAAENGCLADCAIIAAALEVQDPRLRPAEHAAAADDAHRRFSHACSDFGSILLLWDHYHKLRSELSRSQLERTLKQSFLSAARFREWIDVHRQLSRLSEQHRMPIGQRRWYPTAATVESKKDQRKHKQPGGTDPAADADARTLDEIARDADYAAVHRSLLGGLLSGIAMRQLDRTYLAAGNLKTQLWPGSSARVASPPWVVAAEIVETSARFARNVAAIQSSWAAVHASHLLKHSYSSPHFAAKTGQAMLHRKTTLFGLPILPPDRVPLAPIDAVAARTLLIDEGIVAGQLRSRIDFLKHNQQLHEELEEYANRTRQPGLLLDHFFLEQFYHARIPAHVVDHKTLDIWARTLDREDRSEASPYLRFDNLTSPVDPQSILREFPDRLNVGAATVPVAYAYKPGEATDGVTAFVPATAISQVSEDRVDWLVPGLLPDRVLALIKSLPKRLRRNLSPAPDAAAAVTAELLPAYGQQQPFWRTLCEVLSRRAGESIRPEDFDQTKVADHLKMQIAVVDEKGEVRAVDRNLSALRGAVASEVSAAAEPAAAAEIESQPWYRERMRSFDIDRIPETLVVHQRGFSVTKYPTFEAAADRVFTKLADHPTAAEIGLRRGCMRLFQFTFDRQLQSQVRHLPGLGDAQIRFGRVVPSTAWSRAMSDLLAAMAFLDGQPTIRSADDFAVRQVRAVERISVAAAEVGKWLPKLTEAYHRLALKLETLKQTDPVAAEVRTQLAELFRTDFAFWYPWQWLKHYPRYVQAMLSRVEKAAGGGKVADDRAAAQMRPFEDYFAKEIQAAAVTGADAPLLAVEGVPIGELQEYFWMLQELRVSLFAQQLGTAASVSPQRLEKLQQKLASRR